MQLKKLRFVVKDSSEQSNMLDLEVEKQVILVIPFTFYPEVLTEIKENSVKSHFHAHHKKSF